MSDKNQKPPEKFEDAFERLEAIVDRLESGDVALEESLELYTEGMTLVKLCNQKLAVAREKIEKLSAAEEQSGANE